MLDLATNAIGQAKCLIVAAGAGMGVDSGLPDFRGNEGFWKAYPPFAKLGLSFIDLANPQWFRNDPELAWGFYGHRLALYRNTQPHKGFDLIQQWAANQGQELGVFTSNVDGQFQKANYPDMVYECHGSILHLQCQKICSNEIWTAPVAPSVDPNTMRAQSPLPTCPNCGAVARPNILMFGDWHWISDRSDQQAVILENLLSDQLEQTAIIEIGAGTSVPSVRHFSERCQAQGATLIRINPREAQGPTGTISIADHALSALEQIHQRIQ